MTESLSSEHFWINQVQQGVTLGVRNTKVPKKYISLDTAVTLTIRNRFSLLVLDDYYLFVNDNNGKDNV